MKEKKSDNRISHAIAIKDLMSKSGFKVLQGEYERIKEQAFANLIDERLPESNLSQRQKIYNQIVEWIDLPASIMKRGETAVDEEKADKERKDHPIKSNIPFMKNRY